MSTSLFTWWNAIYSLPLAFVLLFLTITSIISLIGGAIGGLSHGDAETDVDADVDADVDVDADAGEVAGHGDHGHDHDHSDLSALTAVLAFLGVGRAPLVMLLQILLLLWGLIGVGLHQAFRAAGPSALLWSLPVTLVFSVAGTRGFAALFGRFFKPMETSVLRRDQIVGRTGRVVFPVTEETGTVHVRDQNGTLHRLQARAAHERLESGQEIIVLGYDPEKKRYQVDDASSFIDR